MWGFCSSWRMAAATLDVTCGLASVGQDAALLSASGDGWRRFSKGLWMGGIRWWSRGMGERFVPNDTVFGEG